MLDSVGAYEKLDDELNDQIGELASYPWVLKYFRLIFPDQFAAVCSWRAQALSLCLWNPANQQILWDERTACVNQEEDRR